MNLQTAATLEMCVEGNCLMVLLNRCVNQPDTVSLRSVSKTHDYLPYLLIVTH